MSMKQLIKKARVFTKDVAFPYRMGAGFPGDVNRTHPASIEPVLQSSGHPALLYGEAVINDAAVANTVRPLAAGDAAVTIIVGVTVRPYPIQNLTGNINAGQGDALGSGTPPAVGAIDVLRTGYVMVKIPAGQATIKGGAVFVYVNASNGLHIQGGFENAGGGALASLDTTKYQFNGPADVSGNVEIVVNP